MAFKKVCTVEDIWEGEMDSFEVDGKETNKAHVYEEAWNFLPKGYIGVTD
mgnify:CR=1 FL=1